MHSVGVETENSTENWVSQSALSAVKENSSIFQRKMAKELSFSGCILGREKIPFLKICNHGPAFTWLWSLNSKLLNSPKMYKQKQ